jgi:hypothetical protein
MFRLQVWKPARTLQSMALCWTRFLEGHRDICLLTLGRFSKNSSVPGRRGISHDHVNEANVNSVPVSGYTHTQPLGLFFLDANAMLTNHALCFCGDKKICCTVYNDLRFLVQVLVQVCGSMY